MTKRGNIRDTFFYSSINVYINIFLVSPQNWKLWVSYILYIVYSLCVVTICFLTSLVGGKIDQKKDIPVQFSYGQECKELTNVCK